MGAKPAVLQMGVPEYSPLRSTLESKYTYYPWWEMEETVAFLAERGSSIRGIVTDSLCCVNEDLLSKLPSLEIVSSCSVGIDKLDLEFCKRRGVVVTNTPDVLTDDVADTAMALLLATVRQTCVADRFVREGKWRASRYPLRPQVSSKRVGIVGLGRIGGAIAKRAKGMGCSVGYWGRSEKTGVPYKYFGNLVDLAKDSDILIAACALTEETSRIVNREVMDALGPEGYLVNIARGQVVDEAELVKALTEGRLAGAGLDVFEKEPHVPRQLLDMDNVVLLPHAGTGTWETSKAMADIVVANLEAHFSGSPVLTPVT